MDSVYRVPELAERVLAHLPEKSLEALYADDDLKSLVRTLHNSNAYWRAKTEVRLGYRIDKEFSNWRTVFDSIGNDLQRSMLTACLKGINNTATLLFEDPRVTPNASALFLSVRFGHREIVDMLLKYPNIDPSSNNNYAISCATKGNHKRVVASLLADPRLKSLNANHLLCEAVIVGNMEILAMLLADSRINSVGLNNIAIILAARHQKVKMVAMLLEDGRVDPSNQNNEAIKSAANVGNVELVRMLMADHRVNPAADNNASIILAAGRGYVDMITLLLRHPLVNPADKDNEALKLAASNGHKEVVVLLLMDRRVNPSKGLAGAIEYQRKDVLALLLEDLRVDPNYRDYQDPDSLPTIHGAVLEGNVDILVMLLAHPKIDTRGITRETLEDAMEFGHEDIIAVLLEDPRINLSIF